MMVCTSATFVILAIMVDQKVYKRSQMEKLGPFYNKKILQFDLDGGLLNIGLNCMIFIKN